MSARLWRSTGKHLIEKTIKDTLDWLRYGLQKTDASTASVFCIVLIKIYRKTLAHIRIVLYLYICDCNIWLENEQKVFMVGNPDIAVFHVL